MKCLMLGAGSGKPEVKVSTEEGDNVERDWTTLDLMPIHSPDIEFDLSLIKWGVGIPVDSESFDEIHAYEVLEHFSQQGDFKAFFKEFREFWRILKSGGFFYGSCPTRGSFWQWGDPGHTRTISMGTLTFLTKSHYIDEKKSASSNYSDYVDPCWWTVEGSGERDETFFFILRKVICES